MKTNLTALCAHTVETVAPGTDVADTERGRRQ
jgi:hypothetical protein